MAQDSITFIGTAGDNFVASKQIAASGGLVLSTNGMTFLFNPGPGSVVRAKQVGLNLRDLSGVVLSDTSMLRSNDINVVIDAMTYSGFDKRGLLIGPKKAIDGDNRILLDDYKSHIEKIIFMDAGKRVGIDDIELLGIKTNKADVIGYKLVTSAYTICYLPEVEYSVDLFEELQGVDILILGLKHEFGAQETKEGNLTFEQASQIIKEVKPRLTIVSDFSITVTQNDPIYQARLLQKETGTQVIAAKDGFSVNPRSYARMRSN